MILLENTPQSLYTIKKHFDEGRWALPEHQRKLVWGASKQKEWFNDIVKIHEAGGGTVVGCVVIYQIKGSTDERKWLNDGAQRVFWTIKKFIEKCNEKGVDYKEILQNVSITVQRVEYNSSYEAIKDFIKINFGSTATPYELTRTMLCHELNNFSEFWEPRLEKVQQIIKECFVRLGTDVEDRSNVEKREQSHKRIRDELHLFWKFISGDKSRWSPRVGLSTLKPDQWEVESEIERRLIDCLSKLSLNEIDKKIKSFEKWMIEQTALYEEIWNKVKNFAEAPANVHLRWWFLVAMFFRNTNRDHNLREFTNKLISNCDGRTSLFYKNKNKQECNCNIAMSQLSKLGQICTIIDSKFPEPKEKRKKEKNQLKPGFVHSHVLSYSLHGNGPTLIENAKDNRLRGSAPMTQSEKTRLDKLNKIF
jgi:hypothetical protein